jgi:hypothetical protein
MNAKRMLARYDQIADTPDAIVRMRRFILDLAVRGKLVPQDASDEPASELLKRIAKEKARLVKAGETQALQHPLDRHRVPLTSGRSCSDLSSASWRTAAHRTARS